MLVADDVELDQSIQLVLLAEITLVADEVVYDALIWIIGKYPEERHLRSVIRPFSTYL